MSRERHSLRFAAPVVAGIVLAVAGCSAGLISQTAGMEPAVNGGMGNLGPIAVRDIQLAYPAGGVYERGEEAAVLGSIVNSGQTTDELLSVTSSAGEVIIVGDKSLPPGRALMAGEPDEKLTPTTTSTSSSTVTTTGTTTTTTTTTSTPSSGAQSPTSGSSSSTTTTAPRTTSSSAPPNPVTIGKVNIVISRLAEEIRSGKTVELTFTFRNGQVTVAVPIAVPTTPRKPAVTEGH